MGVDVVKLIESALAMLDRAAAAAKVVRILRSVDIVL
jgi:hypothetical protein